jgi:hypothetical protein
MASITVGANVEASFTQRHVGLPGGEVGPLDFTPAEVKQLWWFLDGAILRRTPRRGGGTLGGDGGTNESTPQDGAARRREQ